MLSTKQKEAKKIVREFHTFMAELNLTKKEFNDRISLFNQLTNFCLQKTQEGFLNIETYMNSPDSYICFFSTYKLDVKKYQIWVYEITTSQPNEIGRLEARFILNNEAFLDWIYTSRDFRNLNIATKQMNHFISIARKFNMKEISGTFHTYDGWSKENVEGLKRFYSRNGFSIENFDEDKQKARIRLILN